MASISGIKLLYHTWFRTGSAYTSNGIVSFLQEVKSTLPPTIKKVFFRTDSGFFSGELFDLPESFTWDYLVKVKLKNLKKLLGQQICLPVEGNKDIAICEFAYKPGGCAKRKASSKNRNTGHLLIGLLQFLQITTNSGHQIESTIANANKNKQFSEQLKMYSLSRFIGKHHFYKSDWEELDRLIEAA